MGYQRRFKSKILKKKSLFRLKEEKKQEEEEENIFCRGGDRRKRTRDRRRTSLLIFFFFSLVSPVSFHPPSIYINHLLVIIDTQICFLELPFC
jgi:hypothetical protein